MCATKLTMILMMGKILPFCTFVVNNCFPIVCADDIIWWNSPRDVVAALQKRLTHRSANVQLYALTVC